MPTDRRPATASSFASFLDIPRFWVRPSVSWRPILTTGFKDVIGSWNTIAISRPHRRRSLLGDSPTSSRPSYTTLPSRRTLRAMMIPMIERDSTVLPEPDSPTTPSVLPRSRVKLTPSTARTLPASSWK